MKPSRQRILHSYPTLIVLLPLLLFMALPAQLKSYQMIGQTYYVSLSGDDNNTGSAEDPWRTVQKAAESVGPGDTVLIQPGIYRESVILRQSGQPGAPIVFRADDGGLQQGEKSVRLWGSEDSRGMIWHDLNAPECDASRLSAVSPQNYSQVFCTNLAGDDWRFEASFIVPDLVTAVAENGDLSRLIKAREPDQKLVTPQKHHEFWWTAAGGSSPSGGVSSATLFDATDDTVPVGIEAGNLSTVGDLAGGTLFALDTMVGTSHYRREIKAMMPEGCTPGLDCTGIHLSTTPELASRPVDFDFGTLDGLGPLTKYYVEGAPQLLDQPGEWVYDLQANKLYIWSDTSPATRHFEIAKRHLGLSFSDPANSQQSVSEITIDGLSVAMINANFSYRADPAETMLRPMLNVNALLPTDIQGAVTFFNRSMTASSGLTLQNLQITHASNGIQFFQESSSEIRAINIQILASEIGYIDGQAIRIQAEVNGAAANFPAIDGLTLAGNHIHHVGFRPSDPGLEQGVAVHLGSQGLQNLILSDNLLEIVSHNGVSLSGAAPDNLPQSLLLRNNTIRQTCLNGAHCAPVSAGSAGQPLDTLTLTENVLEDNQGWSYAHSTCQTFYNTLDKMACMEQWSADGQVSSPPVLTLQPEQSSFQIGDVVAVKASISGASQLVRLQMSCTVDPAVLTWEQVQLGDFFTAPVIEQNELDKVSGLWQGRISQLPPAPALTGEGRFVTFILKVVGAGTSAITCDPLAFQAEGAPLPIASLSDPLTVPEVLVAQVYDLPGQVAYHGRRNQTGIAVRVIEQPEMQSMSGADGQFTVAGLATGVYTLQADARLYLPSCTPVTIGPEPYILNPVVLAGGDTDDDDQIKINDVTLIGSNFGLGAATTPAMNDRADINADGRIDVLDLTIMASNFGKAGCQPWADAAVAAVASSQ